MEIQICMKKCRAPERANMWVKMDEYSQQKCLLEFKLYVKIKHVTSITQNMG